MIIFSDEVFSVLKLVVFLNILCKTNFIYYYFFFFYCLSQQKGNFTGAPGPQAGGCPVGRDAGRAALFDILPGAQVVVLTTGAIGDRNAAGILSQLYF